MWLRLDGDSDDPATWHQIKTIRDEGFTTDASQPCVQALTVSFHHATPELMLNDDDPVEFAVIRPPDHPQS
jgi:hypothetical protein